MVACTPCAPTRTTRLACHARGAVCSSVQTASSRPSKPRRRLRKAILTHRAARAGAIGAGLHALLPRTELAGDCTGVAGLRTVRDCALVRRDVLHLLQRRLSSGRRGLGPTNSSHRTDADVQAHSHRQSCAPCCWGSRRRITHRAREPVLNVAGARLLGSTVAHIDLQRLNRWSPPEACSMRV